MHLDIDAADKEYQCPVLYKMTKMLQGARTRAQLYNRDFNITIDDLLELYVEVCPILNLDILWHNTEKVRHGSPSLDRINNRKGYIRGNIHIISHRANSLKKDYLLVEWQKMKDYMEMCDGNPMVITDAHFKEYNGLDDIQQRNIRAALRRNQGIINISKDLEITVGQILNYLNRGLKL